MEGLTIFFKLFCAHLCADFILQPDKINKGKRKNGLIGILYLSLHGLIHATCAYTFVAQWSNWLLPLIIFISHSIIDYIKCKFCEDTTRTFIIDQICHVAVMVTLWLFMFTNNEFVQILWNRLSKTNVWLMTAAYLLMLKPSAILLNLFLKKWDQEKGDYRSLQNAGQWIGYIERVLILTFILIGGTECIGFLLAAKSVFRFGELNKPSEIKTTEYVLIGTLSSFALAIITGVILRSLMI